MSMNVVHGEERIPAHKESGDNWAQSVASDGIEGSMSEFSEDDCEEDCEDDCEDDGEDDDEDNCEDDDELEEWPWLHRMFARVEQEVDGKPDQIVAECKAYLIQRSWIRDKFYREMEEPSQEMSELAFTLFDRWGHLKSNFKDHPVKKGTGVWGDELDNGELLLVELLLVKKDFRRQGKGKKLIEEVWERARITDSECKFALTRPDQLNTTDERIRTENMSAAEREEDYHRNQATSVAFYRRMGFRRIGSTEWFGLAADPEHPSRKLAAEDDYDPPEDTRLTQPIPIHDAFHAILNPQSESVQTAGEYCYEEGSPDYFTSAVLKMFSDRCTRHHQPDPAWGALDQQGNTILHLLANSSLLDPLKWLLEMPFSKDLLEVRNHEGQTPAEVFQSSLESGRVKLSFGLMDLDISDKFRGYTSGEVECLLMLQGITTPSAEETIRATYGCTCETCSSFLSPRMRFALEVQADLQYDVMKNLGTDYGTPAQWTNWNIEQLIHLSGDVRKNLKTNKTMRQGVTNIFRYVAKCLNLNQLPTTAHVLQIAELSKEPHSCTETFLQRGGTVDAVVQACFDAVIDQDIYLGDGQYEECFSEDIVTRPKCRNDREFEFARRMFTLQEKKQASAPGSTLGKRKLEADEADGPHSGKKR